MSGGIVRAEAHERERAVCAEWKPIAPAIDASSRRVIL